MNGESQSMRAESTDAEKDRLLRSLAESQLPEQSRFASGLRARLKSERVLPAMAGEKAGVRWLGTLATPRRSVALVGALVVAAVVYVQWNPFEARAVAQFLATVGDDGQAGWRTAGEMLDAGEKVSSGAGALASLLLADGSVVRIGERSEVSVEGNRRVQLDRGRVYADVAQSRKVEFFQIKTNEATITVLGTAFEVVSEGDETTVTVTHGRVRVEWGSESVILTERETMTVSRDTVHPKKGTASGNEPEWVIPLVAQEQKRPFIQAIAEHFPSRSQDLYNGTTTSQ